MLCWELRKRTLVGILHVDSTCMAWSLGLRNLILPPGSEIMPVAGMPFDMARNVICQQALRGGYEWAFHLDSDVVTPRDVIPRLQAHNKGIVSGVYHRRSPPHAIPVAIKNGTWYLDAKPNTGVHEVDVVGAGCLLIHRSVLERLPPQCPQLGKHWFWWRVDQQGLRDEKGNLLYHPGECLSEDFSFCQHAKKTLNMSTYLDTSVQCRHIGLAQATYGNFVPCDTTPHT